MSSAEIMRVNLKPPAEDFSRQAVSYLVYAYIYCFTLNFSVNCSPYKCIDIIIPLRIANNLLKIVNDPFIS